MIQTHRLDEAAYRGDFDLGFDQKGNNDLLVLTRPEIIADITRAYLDAGSDIASTHTFNANRISQADYGAAHLVAAITHAAAPIARHDADAHAAAARRPPLVAGAHAPPDPPFPPSLPVH